MFSQVDVESADLEVEDLVAAQIVAATNEPESVETHVGVLDNPGPGSTTTTLGGEATIKNQNAISIEN